MNQQDYELWLTNIPGIGSRKMRQLLQVFDNPQEIYGAERNELSKVKGICQRDVDAIWKSRKEGIWQEIKKEMEAQGVQYVSYLSDKFPAMCREIYNPPKQLFFRGELPREEICIAIVGARHCSLYGREVALQFARQLAKAGIGIVSGMARGIDGWSHQGALEAGGKTYAVLGNSVEIPYPREHQRLYQSICKHGGVISEYPPGTSPRPGFFPMRNRIISGLTQGILVVEAMEKSGSLITAKEALEQGKDVFVIPGRVGDLLSEGCNNLIQQGAYLVTKPEEIMLHYGIEKQENLENLKIFLESKEKMVYASLRLEPKHVSELARELNMDLMEVMKCIHTLLKQGFVQEIGNHYYMKKTYSD